MTTKSDAQETKNEVHKKDITSPSSFATSVSYGNKKHINMINRQNHYHNLNLKNMNNKICNIIGLMIVILAFTSCRSSKPTFDYSMVNAPEEAGIIFTKVTPEGIPVIALAKSAAKQLAINPDGTKLALISRSNDNDNIYTMDLKNTNIMQQRTFRNTIGLEFVFSPNGEELLFSSNNEILITNANSGSICKQLTTGFWPIYSNDGKHIYFERSENNKDFIWRYSLDDKELATLCSGMAVSPSKSNDEIFILRTVYRKKGSFNEIRKINITNGAEEVILSNEDIDAAQVQISPDGKWLLFAAWPYNTNTKKWERRQLYVIRVDGTDLTRLTHHPANSFSPVWSADGKKIYFISGRGNSEQKHAVWSMDFTL